MNLFLAVLMLAAGVGLFVYQFVTGTTPFTILRRDVSAGWLFLLLGTYNLARWYSSRANRSEQQALLAAHEARLRQARHREPPAEPDPTFDFTDKPPPRASSGIVQNPDERGNKS